MHFIDNGGKIMKRIISILLAALMLVSSTVFAENKNEYSDWSAEHIKKAQSLGILGDLDLVWKADITREQFCVIVYNMLTKIPKRQLAVCENNPFEDTNKKEVNDLYASGIINGKADRIFAPNDTLTREEAATILGRIASYLYIYAFVTDFVFEDSKDISDWAKESVQTVCNLKVMNGVGDNKFDPKGKYTAEQAVTTIIRMYDYLFRISVVDVSFADRLNRSMPDGENYMFSPLSIKMALLLAANGAKGATQSEILKAVNVKDLDTYNEKVKKMLSDYSQSDLLRLDISNSAWINTSTAGDTRFLPEYEKKMADYYRSTSETVTSGNAVRAINDWVNDKTNGKIPTIISDREADFWAMLINAVYFKARWQNEFSKHGTVKDNFTSKDGSVSQIDFMKQNGWMSYSNVDGVKIVELPYLTRQDKLSDDGDIIGIETVDNVEVSMYLMMSDYDFDPIRALDMASSESRFIALSVPKFKIEFSTDLSETLKNFGLSHAFSPYAADFTDMFNRKGMFISEVIHKTYISVDEEGTEAAAVTKIGFMPNSAMPPEPMQLKFDNPFTFVIKDKVNDEILFVGEYSYAKE
ncbi:MAG: hypothetical protein E7656_04930 [Ruminococcaceae bacterium]|nr:hypothetical protein [Oscillospiraceae bacterium]